VPTSVTISWLQWIIWNSSTGIYPRLQQEDRKLIAYST
jgi:hypothetical protein